ncbi:hypothetical protein VC273_21255 [Xanthomonas nasturtii]|nr:hypothetical protein [Xanthomonas nasturtii]MEA9558325.1 hypothetical protein [Xanthomonas nasturtii]
MEHSSTKRGAEPLLGRLAATPPRSAGIAAAHGRLEDCRQPVRQ